MKKQLLTLPLILLPLASCGSNTNSYENKVKIIDALLEHVNVDATLIEHYSFKDYSYLNFSNEQHVNRDYGYIYINGVKTPATRDNGDYNSITYYEGDSGQALYQVLTNSNEVISKTKYINSMIATYADNYASPFDYLDADDILDGYYLKDYKASIILQTLFGVDANVKEAKINLKNGLATSIDFDIRDQILHYAASYDMYIEAVISKEVKLSLSYDTPKLNALNAKENNDEIIKNALNNLSNNYTLTFKSPNLSEDVTLYNTGDYIYLHNDSEHIGANNGDILYKKNGNNYDKYIYRYSSNKFIKQMSNVKLINILPRFSELSYRLFDKQSEGIYYLDSTSATLNAEYLILNDYNYYSEEGISATVEVNDGYITNITSVFGNNQRYIVNETISNYQTTTLPSWLDINSL